MTDLDDPVNENILRRIKGGDYKTGDLKLALNFENYLTAYIVKGLLESVGIFTFLENEYNGLNKFYSESPSDGNISLKIHETDFVLASEILLAELDPYCSYYDDMMSKLTCPNCNSEDYSVYNLSYKLAIIFLAFFSFPLPFRKNLLKCNQCSRVWQIT